MKRLFKWLFVIFVLLALALVLLLWAIVKFTPQEKVRFMAAQKIGQHLNRQVLIGPYHLGWSGLAVDELRLSEIPSFKKGTLLTAKGLRLGWDLRNLWEGMDLQKKMITRSSGHFQIDDFKNPHYSAKDLSLRWSLTDIDATGAHLNGWATLEQGPGLLENVDQLVATSPSAKIALTPLLAVMNLDRLGVLKLGLPDLRHWPIQGIHGKYAFKNGTMTIQPFAIESHELNMGTTGVVQLGNGGLLLDVEMHTPHSTIGGALDSKIHVTGTLSHPKVDLSSLKKKAFQGAVTHVLENPEGAKKDVDNVLKNLFH